MSTWLDSIAAITENDALFVFKDGSEWQLSIIDSNRFFYFADRCFGSGKIDVAKVRSFGVCSYHIQGDRSENRVNPPGHSVSVL